jgi:hypothetical protein
MVLLNPRGHGHNDKFDEIIEQLDFMDNCEQKNNVNKLEYHRIIFMMWILNSLERPRTHSTECLILRKHLASFEDDVS